MSELKLVSKMFDVHCHVDLYPNPLLIANECEKLGIYTIAMTNLPSHFNLGYPNLLSFKKVRLALGMHPLYADRHKTEFPLFKKFLEKTSYVGEIGLDFSKEGLPTKAIQLESFRNILMELQGRTKVISLHSRSAETDVFTLLCNYKIRNAIFHWYTGPLKLIEEISATGYYFSVNPAMIRSPKGQEIVKKIPPQNILTESDGPFIKYQRRSVKPSDLGIVTSYLASIWNKPETIAQDIINSNFKKLITQLV